MDWPTLPAALPCLSLNLTLAQIQAGDATRGLFPFPSGLPAGAYFTLFEFTAPYPFSSGYTSGNPVQVVGTVIAAPIKGNEANNAFVVTGQPATPRPFVVTFSQNWTGGDVYFTGKNASGGDLSGTIPSTPGSAVISTSVDASYVISRMTLITKQTVSADSNPVLVSAALYPLATSVGAVVGNNAGGYQQSGLSPQQTRMDYVNPSVNLWMQCYDGTAQNIAFSTLTKGNAPTDAAWTLQFRGPYTVAP